MTSLAAIGIVARDIAESCRFYRTLGLDVPEPPQGEDHSAEVNETYARLTQAGFTGKKEPYDAFWGQRYANVAELVGNVVDLFAPL